MKKLMSILLIVVLFVSMLPLNALAATPRYVQVTKDNAPLRSGKAEKYSVVVRATKGTILEVLDSSYNWYLNKWYKVKIANGSAYIYSGNVKKVSASGFTKAITLSKSSMTLNLSGTDAQKLKCTVKYTKKTDTNVTFTSSNKAVATVNASGQVVAKKLGTATITCKHKIYGTVATCKVTVTDKVILNAVSKEQSNNHCCSGAAARAVLKCLKGSSFNKTDLQLYKEMNSEGAVWRVVNLLNKYMGKTAYKYSVCKTQSTYEQAVIKSIRAGYPVIALVKITDNKVFKYTSNGHFTVIDGFQIAADGSVTFHICDSFKTSKNGGEFNIAAKTLFKYSKSHGYPYYLILKK